MPVKERRYLKSSYGAKKRKLPEDLNFLKGIVFYTIAEHKIGNNKNIYIEFQPRSIKNISALFTNIFYF